MYSRCPSLTAMSRCGNMGGDVPRAVLRRSRVAPAFLRNRKAAMLDQQVPLPKEQVAPDRPAEQPAVLQRLASVDAFRGLVLFLMIAEIFLQLHAVGKALPESRFWQFLRHQQLHVDWAGTSLHDLIHPSFTFLV